MKKIIFTAIAILFLSLTGYAQITTLDKFFEQYAEKEEFTYVFNGQGKCLMKCLPNDLKKELSSVYFTKHLSCRETSNELIKQLKEILKTEKYELVQKIKNECQNSETYQKKSENKDFEQVTLVSNQVRTSVRWISGKLK
jgi:hypothetical protein